MRRLTYLVAMILLGITSLALLMWYLGYRVNTTDSIPIGLYRLSSDHHFKNSFVIFCPDNRLAFQQGFVRGYFNKGLCPSGYGYLMKKVVATVGDDVSVTIDGVYINNKRIPYSKPKLKDGMNRPLQSWQANHYQLKQDEVITMTNQSEWSFDSRYYGPIHTWQIKGVLTPIWVIKTEENTHEK